MKKTDKSIYLTNLQNFVFRGLLLNESLGELKESGIYSVENEPISHEEGISLEDFSLNIRINAIKMSSIYTAFFCFENSVRELVSSRLKERYGSDWWSKCAPQKIKQKVENRRNKEAVNRWNTSVALKLPLDSL